MSKFTRKLAGAGGFWNVMDERTDPAVEKQLTPFSCVAAVGVMLLRDRGITMTQGEVIGIIGETTTAKALAHLLNRLETIVDNQEWHGVIVSEDDLLIIAASRKFAAVFREGRPLGHMVYVLGFEAGLLRIADPWEGTAYLMSIEEFRRVCGGEVVFRWKLSI